MNERYATLHELQTVYSLEDAYLMLEALAVKAANEQAQMEAAKRDEHFRR